MRLQVLDPTARFSCGSCTACCDQPWRTLIDADKAHALEQHDFSAYPQLVHKTYYHRPRDAPDGHYVLAKGEGTRCLFLDRDGLCIIHKELGAQAKPRACLGFPYMVARTAADDRISVDFGCPAVQDRAGRPLTEQADDVAAVIRLSKKPPDPAARTRLDTTRTLSAAEADAVYDRLLSIFADRADADIWRCFGEALALATALQRYKENVRVEEDATLIELLCSDAQLPSTPDIPEISAFDRPVAAPSPVRLLFAATLFRDTAPIDATSYAGLWKRLTMLPKLMSLARFSGAYASRVLGRNISVADVMQHPVAPQLDPAATGLLLRYMRSRIWQRLLVGTRLSVVGGLHQHVHDFNAVIFFARADAQHAGDQRLTHALVRNGLRYVEFHLANQPRVFDQSRVGWFQAQLESTAIAFQSLRLMSLRTPSAAPPAMAARDGAPNV